MFPTELQGEATPLTEEDRQSAVYFSGSSLRHQRLGYLLQKRFPGLLKGWFVVEPKPRSGKAKLAQAASSLSGGLSFKEAVKKLTLPRVIRMGRRGQDLAATRLYRFSYPKVEAQMFGDEVAHLKAGAELHPETVVGTKDPRVKQFLDDVDPYLLLTFGGPLIPGRILNSIRGMCINQHAGHSPDLKGSHTTEMAIYQRRLDWVGSTVHVMDTFADSGDILRRSLATIHEGDSAAEAFLSVTALGNHLMLEAVGTALKGDEIDTFSQPLGQGLTVLNTQLGYHRRREMMKRGRKIVASELRAARDF